MVKTILLSQYFGCKKLYHIPQFVPTMQFSILDRVQSFAKEMFDRSAKIGVSWFPHPIFHCIPKIFEIKFSITLKCNLKLEMKVQLQVHILTMRLFYETLLADYFYEVSTCLSFYGLKYSENQIFKLWQTAFLKI